MVYKISIITRYVYLYLPVLHVITLISVILSLPPVLCHTLTAVKQRAIVLIIIEHNVLKTKHLDFYWQRSNSSTKGKFIIFANATFKNVHCERSLPQNFRMKALMQKKASCHAVFSRGSVCQRFEVAKELKLNFELSDETRKKNSIKKM